MFRPLAIPIAISFLNLRVHAIHLLRVDLDVRDNVCPGLICTALHDALPHVRLHEAAELVNTG